MLLQLLKRLQIIVWLLLTFNLTFLYTTILSTVYTITPTVAIALAAETNADIVATSTSAALTSSTAIISSKTISSSALANFNKRLHLQLQHHQYQQQQYPASYQNYPYSPHIATELMEPLETPIQQVPMNQQPHQRQPTEFTSQTLKHKMTSSFSTTNKANIRSTSAGSPGHMDSNEHNNNIIDINYKSLNSHHNRLHATKDVTLQHLTRSGNEESNEEDSLPKVPQPYFDLAMPRNITARAGQIAAINCRVENLGDKSVSWIRKRDLHILTAGILTYTSDERFKVTRTLDRKQWSLHIKYAQPRDSGIYECQVNTEPKMSMGFRLNVIVTPPDAKASISGPADLYVKIGSAITLTCHIKQPSSVHDIGPIHWYRGPYILTPFVVHPNEAAIDMQRISMESKLGDKLQSRLRISNAQLADSGNYTCMPTTAEAASVVVNVLNDESPAAMQKSSATGLIRKQQQQHRYFNITKFIILIILYTLIQQTNLQLWQIKSYYLHKHHYQQHHQHHYQRQHLQRTALTDLLHSTLSPSLMITVSSGLSLSPSSSSSSSSSSSL